jgi:hypothetical protein
MRLEVTLLQSDHLLLPLRRRFRSLVRIVPIPPFQALAVKQRPESMGRIRPFGRHCPFDRKRTQDGKYHCTKKRPSQRQFHD